MENKSSKEALPSSGVSGERRRWITYDAAAEGNENDDAPGGEPRTILDGRSHSLASPAGVPTEPPAVGATARRQGTAHHRYLHSQEGQGVAGALSSWGVWDTWRTLDDLRPR